MNTRNLVALGLLAAAPAAAQQPTPEHVQMSLEDFLRLYESGKTRPDKPQTAPREWAISSARYKGEVLFEDGEAVSAQFTAKMHVEVLKDKDWVKVQLLPSTVALQSARIGGQEASIVHEDGWYTLVTNRRGGFDVDLQFATQVNDYVGSNGIAFQLVPSAATEVELAVPSDEDLDFTVTNARLTRDRNDGKRRIVEATLPAIGSLAVQWQREIPVEQQQDPRIYAQVFTLVGIGDGVMQATTTIDHTILFAPVDQLQAKIPEGMTLLDVRGTGVRDWTLAGDRTLTVSLNYGAEGSYALTLEMERVMGEGDQTVAAPLVMPLGVERSKGWVGVEARGNLEIAGGDVKAAAPVDVRTLPAAILGITGQPVLLGYKYLGAEPTIPLVVSQHDDVDVLVTVIDQARATTMFTADGRRLTSVTYDVRNNRTQYLRLRLPQQAELWSASVAGKAVTPAKSADGQVLVPLVRSQSSGGALAAFAVEVVYVEGGTAPSEQGSGTFRAELPQVDVPSTYVGWTVYAPWDAKIAKRTVDGSLRDVEYLTFPLGASTVTEIQTYTQDVQTGAAGQVAQGGMGEGAAPVPVRLPIEGRPLTFEKVLALGEPLWVGFEYRGLD